MAIATHVPPQMRHLVHQELQFCPALNKMASHLRPMARRGLLAALARCTGGGPGLPRTVTPSLMHSQQHTAALPSGTSHWCK